MLRTILFLSVLFSTCAAQDVVVHSGGSIQAAIRSAAPGSRVLVLAGTYVEQLDFQGKPIEVIGLAGAAATTIDGGRAGPVVRFVSGEGPASRLQGFTIRGGSASRGAGGVVAASGATPTVEDCVIRDNVGRFGGGVSGSPILRRCSILSNIASQSHGGGLYGAPTLEHCIVAANRCSGAQGAGLYVTGGVAVVDDCVFAENLAILANSRAGAIGMASSGSARIHRSVFVGNGATGGVFPSIGGAIQATAGTVIEACTIVQNTLSGSSVQGGAVYGPATITNSILRGNSAPEIAGGAVLRYCDVAGGASGVGNFDAPAGFVDEVGRDFHLGTGSACVDAGDPQLVDPDGSRSDVGAFPFATLYVRSNTRTADWTSPSWPQVSAVVGGQVVLRTQLTSALAGAAFLVVGSASGTSPGLLLGGRHVPLNPDGYTSFCVGNPNSAVLGPSLGTLGSRGTVDTVFALPGDRAGLPQAWTVHHATLIAGPPGLVREVTNAASLTILPR